MHVDSGSVSIRLMEPPARLSCHGWFRSYNFGSLESVTARWRAAYHAGVDYIATDQYEQLAEFLKTAGAP